MEDQKTNGNGQVDYQKLYGGMYGTSKSDAKVENYQEKYEKMYKTNEKSPNGSPPLKSGLPLSPRQQDQPNPKDRNSFKNREQDNLIRQLSDPVMKIVNWKKDQLSNLPYFLNFIYKYPTINTNDFNLIFFFLR